MMTGTAARRAVDRWRLRSAATVVCAGFACSGGVAFATPRQSTTATVRGVVRDPSNAVLPGANITLTSVDTGQSRPALSALDGSFQFVALSPGTYRLAVALNGFASLERSVELTLDQELALVITLTLPRLAQSVDVVATEQPLIEPTKTSLGRTITTREIEDLPIPAGLTRDFAALATLAPGILTDVATATTGIATAGQVGSNNTFLVDGLSIDGAAVGAINNSLPLDAIREFRVVSNQFSAEFGQASGAVVNVLTRSGTNTPRGRLYYFQQDGAWNATSAPARSKGATDPGVQQKTVGGFWSGPLVRNRAFIFGSAEQVVKRTDYVNTSSVALLFRPNDPLALPVDVLAPKLFGRGDVNLTSSNHLTLRYSYQGTTSSDAAREPLSAAERGRALTNPVQDAAALDTQVLGSSAVNEVRLRWGHNRFEWNVDRFCPGCAALNYPGIKLGKPVNAPQVSISDSEEVADVLTWLRKGGHKFKAGIDARFNQNGGVNPLNFSGTYTFQQDLPFDPANKATYPTRFTQNQGDADIRQRGSIVAVFGEDEWTPRNGLAVNLGVRWDHTTWPGPSGQRDDLAPRLGLSVDPWKTGVTIFRGGLGRYYDESKLQIAHDAEAGVQLTIPNPGFQGSAVDPDPFGPNLRRSGLAVVMYNGNQYTATQTPYTDQASVGLQRQVGRTAGITIDLVRALGHRLPVGHDLNYPDPTTGLRPDPTFQQIIVTETRGQSWYTGLQAGVQRRPAHGYAYSLAYTWSSSENDTDGARSFPQDQTNLLADRGPVLNDARHRLTATGMLDLPLGCRLATVVTARSALPYNVTTGTDDNKDGVSTNDRPAGEGRNAARGSAFFQANVRVSRTLHVSQRRLELLIEAFNVTNRANWTDYNGNKSSVASFGQPASAGPPRQIQLGARFDF